jgi:hypothetical protein
VTKAEVIFERMNEITKLIGPQASKRLDFDTFERIIIRLDSYKDECNICDEFLTHLDNYFAGLQEKKGIMTKEGLSRHREVRTELVVHLMKHHKLIQKGHNMGLYISVGMGVGALLGLTILKNPAIGIPLGMALGFGLGNLLDHDARRKGKVI